ncbi:MAG TPA: RHS repeat domain-containing protein [Candidatus Limnocylindrales bacterium]
MPDRLCLYADANGNATSYTYDALNRLTGITYAAVSTPPVTP